MDCTSTISTGGVPSDGHTNRFCSRRVKYPMSKTHVLLMAQSHLYIMVISFLGFFWLHPEMKDVKVVRLLHVTLAH